jgi:hypothetical protein
LGFVGSGAGISAYATVLINKMVMKSNSWEVGIS